MAHTGEYREEHTVTHLPVENLPHGEETDKNYRLAKRIIYYALGTIESLLGFSFVLKALAANPDSPFVQLVDAVSLPFAAPFQSIFEASATGTGSVFEWSIVFGMIVYLIAAVGLVKLLRLVIKGGNPSIDDAAE